jgi:putative toxin-antitoxin system antitoxin component (TIGR02293 family)
LRRKLFYQGVEAFEGDKQAFLDWLHISVPALGHQKPVDLLKTESGRKSISDAIARVEHNVYG